MKPLTIIGTLIFVVALIYAGIVAYFFVKQRDFQYDRGGRMYELSETKLRSAERVSIPTEDGSQLAAWYDTPKPGMPVILYFRGKTESFSREYTRYEDMEREGFGFLAFDYRGFGGSPGEITEEHVLADSLAAYDWLAAKGLPIVLWGRSLGSGPATYVAGERTAEALFLESPFQSAVKVAERSYPWLPIKLIMLDQFPVDEWIRKVEEPVFVAHGMLDTAMPASDGEAVHRLAPNPVGIWIVPEGTHDNLWERGAWGRGKQFFLASLPLSES